VGGFWYFSVTNILLPLVMPTLALSLSTWVTDVISGREARRQKDFIQGAFGRYVSPKVVSELVADPTKLSIEGERRILSLMFTDIAGFTGLSEVVGSRKLSEILNAYLNEACKIIQKYDGTVDKFIGDAIFAIFNAPIEQPDHAERIIKCAIDLDRFAEDFRAMQIADGIEMGVTRIGIHTGEAVVGNFGAESKMEYTALGDTVNTASRLEGINKYFGTRILVSDTTRSLLPKEMPFRPIALVKPKGRAASLPIWQPLTAEEADDEWIYHWRHAYAAMEAGDEKALALLEQLHAERPDDVTCELHLELWREGKHGVEVVMDSK
jgi:adenylate cyclase